MRWLVWFLIPLTAFGAAKERLATGKIVIRQSKYYLVRDPSALAKSYELSFTSRDAISEVCLANRSPLCPEYEIAFREVRKTKSGPVLIGVRIVGVR